MAAKQSAGLLLYRFRDRKLEVFLVHPGGPFWAKKDLGVWSIPKGEYTADEDPLTAAKREFTEETGAVVEGEFFDLGEVKQAGGKIVKAWALEHDFDHGHLKSDTFTMEWPPRSGKLQVFPEVDAGEWFPIPVATEKLLAAQRAFLTRLNERLSGPHG